MVGIFLRAMFYLFHGKLKYDYAIGNLYVGMFDKYEWYNSFGIKELFLWDDGRRAVWWLGWEISVAGWVGPS